MRNMRSLLGFDFCQAYGSTMQCLMPRLWSGQYRPQRHRLGLFTTEEMRSAFEHTGLAAGLPRSGRPVRSGFAHQGEGSLIVLAPPGHRSGTHSDQRRRCG